MPVAITDKFGKASIDTDYAIATTVKTTRVSGATVLEAFDLSKFSDDTPVFFVTYKKTTDPVTGVPSVTALTSWKGLVNVGANTITNLTLAPGYSDTGNAVGDFVECIPTSYWVNSLIDGIFGGFNPDGTLKTSAVQAALNISDAVPPDYITLAQAPTTIVSNGNRSYTLTFPGVNYTDRLSPGMRLRTTRSVAAPNQCANFDGTNDYFSKASPAGMIFTDDFTVSAWVKLDRYPVGSAVIASRYNSTNGWQLQVGNSGQIYMSGYNAGSGNRSEVNTYQSLPLNKWVHVTAELDMSAFTATPTTSYIMLDGLDVPAAVSRTGTNPTALIQAGNLEIGSGNAGNFFPGKIAQVAIFNAKVTQATMRGYMSQGLSGSEPSLISAYSLSNSISDLSTTNNNHLTANGGVLTTNADSPFGGQASGLISTTVDYGIIQKVAYGAPDTTVVVQVPEGCTIPTSGGVASASYSTARSPYGFPSKSGKWTLDFQFGGNYGRAGGVTIGTWYADTNAPVTIPTGSWEGSWKSPVYSTNSGGNLSTSIFTLSSSTTAESHRKLTQQLNSVSNVSTMTLSMPGYAQDSDIELASATAFYPSVMSPNSTDGTKAILFNADSTAKLCIQFKNAYL